MNLNIFYTADNNFVPQIAAGICSVCENNVSAEMIHIYVGSLNISDKNKEKLTTLIHHYNRQITFVEINNLREKIGFDFDTSGWNNVVLARLLVDQLLPTNVDKVLYLDGDTIVRGSLKELWNTDMHDCVIGASIEPTVNKSRKRELGLLDKHYFNAGVLLINLKLWRNEKTGEKILKYYEEKKGRLFANDQDAINGSLAGKIYIISPKYNFYNIFWYYPYRTLKKLEEPALYISEKIYNEAKDSPVIIHYLGEERPWRKGNTHKYSNDYHLYLSKTDWKNTPMESGWEIYFIFFKIFHTVLSPFPMLKYKIIDFLIPVFMKHRAKKLKNKEVV